MNLVRSEQGENEGSDGPASEAEHQTVPSPSHSTHAAPIANQQVDPQQFTSIVNTLSAIRQLLTQRAGTEANLVNLHAQYSRRSLNVYFQGENVQDPKSIVGELNMYFPSPELTSQLLKHFFDDSPVLPLWPILHKATFQRAYTHFHNASSPTTQVIMLAVVCLISLQLLPESANDVSSQLSSLFF